MATVLLLLVGVLPIPGALGLLCPPDVVAFSSSVSPKHYYKCNVDDRNAVLSECLPGEVYNSKQEMCGKSTREPPAQIKDLKTLGRSAQLGTLYDHRTGMFFPESNLWNQATIKEHSVDQLKPYIYTSFSLVQSVYEKQEWMDINAELGLSFMDGQIKVQGSAGYMSDKVEAKTQVNMALRYERETIFSRIPLHTPMDYLEECQSELFTHFVSEINYGLNAFFVFKRDTQFGEEQTSVQGELEIIVKAIPGFAIEGGGNISITDSQREILNTTHIRMFGDFSPSSKLPSTLEEAVNFYKGLEAEDNIDGATALRVTLTPFKKNACDDLDNNLNDININMISNLRDMLDGLENLDMDLGDLIVSDAAVAFKPLRDNLQYLRTELRKYTLVQKKLMQDILPRVKSGEGAEDEIAKLYDDYVQSQFYKSTCDNFISYRRREVEAVILLMKFFEVESNMELADFERANDVEYIFQRDMVAVMDLNIITPMSLIDAFLNGTDIPDESEYWFNDNTKVAQVGRAVRNLLAFGKRNVDLDDRGYILKISSYDHDTPFTTTALLNGNLISEQFIFPSAPAEPVISSRSNDHFVFKIEKQPFTLGVRANIHDSNGFDNQVDIFFPTNYGTYEEADVTVENMNAGHVYNITISYITAIGESVMSMGTKPFNLPATSAPQALSVASASPSSLQLTWIPPAETAPGVDVDEILYIVKITDDQLVASNFSTKETYLSISDLIDATGYNIDVTAHYTLEWTGVEEVSSGSLPASLHCLTSPLSPSITTSEAGLHSAVVGWTPPARLGSALLHYVVTWSGAGGGGLESETRTLLVPGDVTSTEVTDLAMGQSYTFYVKVVTEAGESVFSEPMNLVTLFEQTEMGKLRDDIFGAIGVASEDLRKEIRFCAIKAETNAEGVITYDRLFTHINTVDNQDSLWMDTAKGQFRARMAGVYRVQVGLEMSWMAGEQHTVSVKLNDQEFTVAMESGDALNEYASWNSLIKMAADDTITVTHSTDSQLPLKSITLCVSSEIL